MSTIVAQLIQLIAYILLSALKPIQSKHNQLLMFNPTTTANKLQEKANRQKTSVFGGGAEAANSEQPEVVVVSQMEQRLGTYTQSLHKDSLLDLEEHAEQLLGDETREKAILQDKQKKEKLTQEERKQPKKNPLNNSSSNFFVTNLGQKREKFAIQQVSISRQDPFSHKFGDIHENMYAFMLEELDDDEASLLERLEEVNRNLDAEINKINGLIGETGPRHSTKYSQIATQLKDNLERRVSEHRTSLTASHDIDTEDIVSSASSDLLGVGGMFQGLDTDFSINNRQSNRASNRSSRIPPGGINVVGNGNQVAANDKMSHQFAEQIKQMQMAQNAQQESDTAPDESQLLSSCDLYRQMRMEQIKVEQNSISEMSVKEKQLRTHQKLEDLKIQLLRLIGDLQESVTYNPFKGAHQAVQRSRDGVASYSSFVMEDADGILTMDADEQKCIRQRKKTEESEKRKMATLLESIVYQLEKLRFILEQNIFPRDMTLRLFNNLEQDQYSELRQNLSQSSRKSAIVILNNNQQLVLAYKLLQKLHNKIINKIQTNTQSMLIQQLQSKVQLQTCIYQSFHGFLAEHANVDSQAETETKNAILKARFEMIGMIKRKNYLDIDMNNHLNQHMIRLVMPKRDKKTTADGIEEMLREDIFMSLKIDHMNWNSLLSNEDEQNHYEVTLQLFFQNGRPLSSKTMIPLIKKRNENANQSMSWAFLQIPMQALISEDLALCFEVYKVSNKYGDVEPIRLLGTTKSCSPVKLLVGWSTINLTATYLLSNMMAGQQYKFKKLRIFESNFGKKGRVTECYQSLTPETVRSSNSSALMTQILSIDGKLSFDTDYLKLKRQIKRDKCIQVDLHRFYDRGIDSKNKEMQKRFMSHVSSPLNMIQLTIGSITLPNHPESGLIQIEVCFVNNAAQIIDESFMSTKTCPEDQLLPVFESETKEITGSRIEFKDTKFLKLPQVEKVVDYRHYSLLLIVKIGLSRDQSNNNFFYQRTSAIEQWRQDPSLFTFEPTYLCTIPILNDEEKILIQDGRHQPKLMLYNQAQFLQMVQRAHQYGHKSKLQNFMFNVCQQEAISIETKLISNQHSSTRVINFIISMQKPNKLSLQNADRMLSKMRALVADNPVELLIHHESILDNTFRIMALEFEQYNDRGKNMNSQVNNIEEEEDRQDVAFEILLLMIDLFHAVFPQYKNLLETYLEQHFYQPKVFVALSSQLHLISNVFMQDMSNAKRFWLTQTLSYLPILIKILRISFIQHQISIEKDKQDKIQHQIVGNPVPLRNIIENNNTIIEEAEENELAESHDTRSAHFGKSQASSKFQQTRSQTKVAGDAPQFGAENSELKQDIEEQKTKNATVGSPKADKSKNMIDDFFNQQQNVENKNLQQSKLADTSKHLTEQLKATDDHEFDDFDAESNFSDDNALLKSGRTDSKDLLSKSMKSEAGQPEFFQSIAQEQLKEDLQTAHKIHIQNDKDARESKRLIRASSRLGNNDFRPFSSILNQLPANEKLEEEDIQKNVAESVIEVFKGCHQDGLKITMYLRGIILKNFDQIIKEVSLVCGAKTASTLLSYLHSPISLKQQFKQTGQIDSGISQYFKDSRGIDENEDPDITRESIQLEVSNYESFVDGEDSNSLVGGSRKIRLMDNFIGESHFPFGAEIDSSTTELSLNRLRVTAMSQILYERTLQRIPGNSNEAIEETVTKFSHYVNLFGNVPNGDNSVNEHHLPLRMHVFYYLHHLFFYVFKDECVFQEIEQKQGRERISGFGNSQLTQERQRTQAANLMRGLVQNPNSYLHKILDIFIKNLHQLSSDLIMFKQNESRVSKILLDFPYLEESMGPFMDMCSLVLLTLISHCSKRLLQNNFFSRPSILAKMLDNFNNLDEIMMFQKPFNAYIDKQRLDISAQFNQNVSEMIMDQFGRELPELYIPVINKLIFRYYYLWLNASNSNLIETRSLQKYGRQVVDFVPGRDDMVFNRTRLLDNGWKLISKFKRKVLPDIIHFKSKQDDIGIIAPKVTSLDSTQELKQMNMRREKQKKTLIDIFERMHQYHERSNQSQGIEEAFKLLIEGALLEFEETNKVLDSSDVLFLMFTKIKYLEMPHKDVNSYINLVNKILDNICRENVNFRVNGEAFRQEFKYYTTLLEETYHTKYHFKQSKAKKNLFLRAMFGCRLIELLSKARQYYEIKKFSKQEYAPILQREFEWNTEIAFLDLFSYQILQSQVDKGEIPWDSEHIKCVTLSDEISAIVDKLVEQRCYARALELNKKVKELYERNYDLERIQKPLQTETFIYQRMHKDKKENYASYFKVEFVGNGHIEEFKNKMFILRSIANQDKSEIEDELRERFDEDLSYIEEAWPSEDQLNHGHKKYCHLVRVKPLTLKEVTEFDMHDMVERREIIFDDEDNQLLDKIQAMPTKLQNFYIQNFKDKFYYQESVRIPGVDAVAFDQKIQVFTVRHKFPYIIGLQQVISKQEKIVSSVRQAIKDIKDTDNALSIIKKIVREQAIDQGNVYSLETTLRKTLVAEINGGFKRYLDFFFNEKSLALKDREELILKLYVTMEEHFANVKESIELFSQHSTHASATSMFYSKLTALERMLAEVEKKTHTKRAIRQAEENKEVQQIQDVMRYSTNVLINERNSCKDYERHNELHQSYLMTQDLSRIETQRNESMIDQVDERMLEELRPQGASILDHTRLSNMNLNNNAAYDDPQAVRTTSHKVYLSRR